MAVCIVFIRRRVMRRLMVYYVELLKWKKQLEEEYGKLDKEIVTIILLYPVRKFGTFIRYIASQISLFLSRYPIIASFVGFIFGVSFSILWFYMMIYQMDYDMTTATIVSSIIGLMLSLGLAFNTMCRCIICLVLPSLCSGKGRGLLLSYALVLVMTHPFMNFKRNIDVMSDTMVCTQEMAANMTRKVTDAAAAPFAGIVNDVKKIMDALVYFSQKLQAAFMKVRDLFVEVIGAINQVFDWLGDMVDICNDNMGAPYRKCASKFDNAYQTCRRKMGFFKFLCEIVKGVGGICHVARIGELLCKITEAIKNAVKVHITDNIKIAMKDVQEVFYFKVDIDYHYNVTLFQSKTFNQIRKDIQREIVEKLKPLSILGSISRVVTLLMLFLTYINAALYLRKFRKKDNHDNWYISKDIHNLDEKRTGMGKPTIFPLTRKEKKKFINPFSCRLLEAEKKKLKRAAIFFAATLVYAAFFLVLDCALWGILDMFERIGGVLVTEEVPSHLKMHVQGNGIMADIYRSLITQFDPLDEAEYSLDTSACMPHPSVPNWNIYKMIGVIYFVCAIFLLAEAYLLRWRHVIAGVYYPERKNFRAIYLYSIILRRRGNILTYIKKVFDSSKDVEGGMISQILARSPLLAKMLRPCGFGYVTCVSCGAARKKGKNNKMIHCENLECKAVYCDDCMPEMNNLCMLCMHPIDYSHITDVSEERDSSDDQEDSTHKRKKKKMHH